MSIYYLINKTKYKYVEYPKMFTPSEIFKLMHCFKYDIKDEMYLEEKKSDGTCQSFKFKYNDNRLYMVDHDQIYMHVQCTINRIESIPICYNEDHPPSWQGGKCTVCNFTICYVPKTAYLNTIIDGENISIPWDPVRHLHQRNNNISDELLLDIKNNIEKYKKYTNDLKNQLKSIH